MTDPFALTKSDLSNLLCHGCEKYLSVLPIVQKGGNFYCGRCDKKGDRVTIYEELAKRMTFPCINEPCTASLRLDQVALHERIYCQYKIIDCPKPNNCAMWLKANNLYSHFADSHKELLCQDSCKLRRTLRDLPIKNFNKHKAAHLLRHQDQSYIFMIYGTCHEDTGDPGYIGSYSYGFGVFYLYKDNHTKTKYELTVTIRHESDDDEDEIFEWLDEDVKMYNSYDHCLGCLDNTCGKGHEKKSLNFLWNRIIEYENSGETLQLTFSLKLTDEKQVQPHSSTALENLSLASKLECPVCFDYLCAPIYNCNNGHSVCSKCKKKLKNCALCQAAICNSRNYILEEIAETLEISCPNACKGCGYVGIVKNTKNHLVNCRYNGY